MPSSATTRNRFEKQGVGENSNTWGVKLNGSVFDLVDFALDGRVPFALSGAKTLSSNNFVADEARGRFLDVTGGTGGTITIPALEKLYLVRNGASGPVVISTGAGGDATIQPSVIAWAASDGANVYTDTSAASALASAASAAAALLSEMNAEDSEIAAAASAASASASAASAALFDADTAFFLASTL